MADEPLRPDSPVQLTLVNVTAPATLPAGYEFEAQVEGDPEMTVHAVVVCHVTLIVTDGYLSMNLSILTFLFRLLFSLKEE